MKKKVLFYLITGIALMSTGCGLVKSTKEEEIIKEIKDEVQEEEITKEFETETEIKEIKDNIRKIENDIITNPNEILIDGNLITLPNSYKELEKMGFTIFDNSKDKNLEYGELGNTSIYYDKYDKDHYTNSQLSAYVGFLDGEIGDVRPIQDCYIYSLGWELQDGEDLDIQWYNGLNKDSTVDEILSIIDIDEDLGNDSYFLLSEFENTVLDGIIKSGKLTWLSVSVDDLDKLDYKRKSEDSNKDIEEIWIEPSEDFKNNFNKITFEGKTFELPLKFDSLTDYGFEVIEKDLEKFETATTYVNTQILYKGEIVCAVRFDYVGEAEVGEKRDISDYVMTTFNINGQCPFEVSFYGGLNKNSTKEEVAKILNLESDNGTMVTYKTYLEQYSFKYLSVEYLLDNLDFITVAVVK